MIVTILVTIVLLGVLIFVHELGHFLAAKTLGVKVERFSLGFPPKMIGKKYGETEYMLSWVPLGGYVKMYGESTEESEEIPPDEQHRSFSHKPAWARFLIVLSGPAFNFLFALLVFWIMFAIDGVPHLAPDVGKIRPDMPAAAAGILPGDRILSINGQAVTYWEDVLVLIRDFKGQPVEFTVDRNGANKTFSLLPKMVGVPNIFGEEEQIPMIGIEASGELIVQKINPLSAIYYGGARTWELTRLTVLSVVKLIQGKISPKTLGGPIFIAQLAGQQAREGLGNFIFLAAVISLNLGILNLLPIPVLDGGHLFFFALEMIFRKPLSLNVRERAQQVGMVFLILFMVFVFYNDLARIFWPGSNGTDTGQPPAVEQHDSTRP